MVARHDFQPLLQDSELTKLLLNAQPLANENWFMKRLTERMLTNAGIQQLAHYGIMIDSIKKIAFSLKSKICSQAIEPFAK